MTTCKMFNATEETAATARNLLDYMSVGNCNYVSTKTVKLLRKEYCRQVKVGSIDMAEDETEKWKGFLKGVIKGFFIDSYKR